MGKRIDKGERGAPGPHGAHSQHYMTNPANTNKETKTERIYMFQAGTDAQSTGYITLTCRHSRMQLCWNMPQSAVCHLMIIQCRQQKTGILAC